MFHYSLRVIDEPKMSEIRILNLCHKKTILIDIYRQSLLKFIDILFKKGIIHKIFSPDILEEGRRNNLLPIPV